MERRTAGTAYLTDGYSLMSSALTRYDPFGDYRATPTQTITDRDYTGDKHNAYIKLIDMGTRWYLPEIGRFLSPDAIVPDPSNPQSFNRYAYVRNSPINLKDPTGHRECDAESLDCSIPTAFVPPPPLLLFEFVGDFTLAEIATFYQAGMELARAMADSTPEYDSPRELFLAAFGGPVVLDRRGVSCQAANGDDCYGMHYSDNTIHVYTDANGHIVGNMMWVLHELFHTFNAQAIPIGGELGVPYRQLERNPVLFNGDPISPFAGRARTPDGYRPGENGSARTPYRQSWDDLTVGEDFADMGANWAANSFAAGDAGTARYDWIDSRMRFWVALAMNHNQ